ncbi:MAG: DUF1659 domain-containing protein [Bacilli bacterium]|uniref:DUF1659 domain-containing protein n=3 Tax=Lactobacillus TaxID=1578 RepID=D0R6G6_LACJF|nr:MULTISPECIES: DUF1659 domain-containing protein [Bacillota]MCI6693652.1 DUF1659 domain-containing protein [Clostridium sp.]MCI7187972.1 DUF1659 domain-containing protein [Fusobacterium mortiferum]MDY5057983.1 DUF1659 domain-containing protein [Bacilli bacterium]AOG27165.1 DUF1659 domain-containing protein [Lactobacillus johnsonii]AOG27187.1 DUF1659 domain-containing protein [Lactobacillus johnsonii]
MKILSAFTGRKMTVSYMVDGEEKKKSFSLAHVKQDASYENIYTVAQALGSLVNGTVVGTQVSDTNIIDADGE